MPSPTPGNGAGRHVLCGHYRICLDVAVREKWPSFSCSSCPDYTPEVGSDKYWIDQAGRCADLLVELIPKHRPR
jgi:hypothetical protein